MSTKLWHSAKGDFDHTHTHKKKKGSKNQSKSGTAHIGVKIAH